MHLPGGIAGLPVHGSRCGVMAVTAMKGLAHQEGETRATEKIFQTISLRRASIMMAEIVSRYSGLKHSRSSGSQTNQATPEEFEGD